MQSESPPISKSITEELEDVVRNHDGEQIEVRELTRALHEKGFGLLLMVLVLPNCVPIPIPPGMSTIFSLPLLFFTVQMAFGRAVPWLPKWLRQKTISQSFLLRIIAVVKPKLQKIERVLRPRLMFANTKAGERFVGVMWLMFSISIAVPLPMTNFLPGVGILVSALGMIGRDGYVVLAGFAIGCAGLVLTTLILLLGSSAVMAIIS